MLVGVHTRYCRCEATLLAHRIADVVQQHGADVTLYTHDNHWPPLQPTWDKRVIRSRDVSYTRWAADCSCIIWTEIPTLAQLRWANDHGKRTVVIPDWRDLGTAHRRILEAAGTVVCTSRYFAGLLQDRWHLNNCLTTCWDPGVPLVEKRVPPEGRIRLLYPLEWITPASQPSIILMLSHLLNVADVALTVLYLPSRIDSPCRRFLDNLQNMHPDRVKLLRRAPLTDLSWHFAAHDLTIWPSASDHTGCGALMSVYGGTPVVAFNVPPLNEFLSPTNSSLVPCGHRQSSLGALRARLDYNAFGSRLSALVTHPANLRELYGRGTLLLRERMQLFRDGWRSVLAH